jgi:hypothetical protein
MLSKTIAGMAFAVASLTAAQAMAQAPMQMTGTPSPIYQFNGAPTGPIPGYSPGPCPTDPSGGGGCFNPNGCGVFGNSGGGGGPFAGAAGSGGLASLLGYSADSDISIGGWLQAGYHSEDGLARFNTHPDRFNLHQGWLYAEKTADGSEGWGWGFRVDAMYGVDGADTQAFGNSPGRWDFANGFDHGQYAFAIPQAYVEVATGDWSVKAGHFFTLVGYEVVTAPDNFFYSHAFTMYNSEPFTHTGVLATYNADDNLTLYGGWTTGWDTGFDTFNNGSSFLGGAAFTLSESVTFTYITTIGNFGARGEGYGHSLVLDMQLNDNVNYVIQSDYLDTDSATGPLGLAGDEQYGINQYLIGKINDTLSVGGRFEWWNVSGVSVYDATLGLNVKVMDDITIRPEIRKDWAPGIDLDETIFGVDAIFTF